MARVFLWTLAAVIFFSGTPILAQGLRPPVEVGLGISRVSTHEEADVAIPSQSPDIRVTIPTSPRFALEVGISAAGRDEPYAQGVVGYYTIQVKQRIVRGTRGGFHPFVTYGAVGHFLHRRLSPSDFLTPNGGMKPFPKSALTEIWLPLLAAVGGGIQRELGSHVALRADAQLLTFLVLPLGARFTTSISIPLGRYHRN